MYSRFFVRYSASVSSRRIKPSNIINNVLLLIDLATVIG